MFGVLAPRIALDLLSGRSVRRSIAVDIHDLPRTRQARWQAGLGRMTALARLAPSALAMRRAGTSADPRPRAEA
jgi:hypothetical protein